MIGIIYIEEFLRSKIALQEQLFEAVDFPGKREIEAQIETIELRTGARIQQSVQHGIEEIRSLRLILKDITEPVKKE